ncbi:MAG: polysaccharide pyruvyl transferase family protein [Lachnospiraceae bacterium]|nr:polysaccharide pyruvyl transferase family protein [Lachnospiraceae bacterium]
MRYANFSDTGKKNVNIGDYLQLIVVEYLYHLMDIPKKEIVRFSVKELENYDGEPVVLPCCFFCVDYIKSGRIAVSPKITPIFFGISFSTVDKFMDLEQFFGDEYNINYLRNYAPIGCRDEFTYDLMLKYDIPAYINGCMTAVFPRQEERMGNKVFLIDAPKSVLPYIPMSILESYEISTQQYYFSDEEIENHEKMFDFVVSKYRYYLETAKLIITSRLHVALPLSAMGIPVVLTKDNVDGRFSFLERYIPIYQKEIYDVINWNLKLEEWEDMKRLLITHAIKRIKNGGGCDDELKSMEDSFTESFKKRTVRCVYKPSYSITHANGERFSEYAKKYWKKDDDINYAFWGISENNAEYWRNYIESQYPKAKLVALFDSYRKGERWGIEFQHPDNILFCENVCVIVCSVGAAQAAKEFFRENQVPQEKYYITSDCFIGNGDVEDRLSCEQ